MLVYDHIWLAEPNLLIPHKKPIGAVRLRKGIAGFNPEFYALLHQKDLDTLTGGKWGVNLASNPAYSCDHWTQSYASGWGLHPEGLYKDASGELLSHNYCHLYHTASETVSMPGNFQYLAVGITIKFTSVADDAFFGWRLISSGNYNYINFDTIDNIIVKIGNTSSSIAIDALEANKDYSIVILYDQTGASRDSYCFINGKVFSSLGTTKDTTHDNNEGIHTLVNARTGSNYGPDFVIKTLWWQTQKLPLGLARQISMDPYMVLEPA